MNAKRILPWEDDDWNWSVKTWCGDLSVVRDDETGEWLAKWIYVDDDDTIGRYPDAESAIDACEADYLARCTEFLTLYDPKTHVVVSRECAEAALFNIPDSAEGGVSPREHAARAELRAALEGGR